MQQCQRSRGANLWLEVRGQTQPLPELTASHTWEHSKSLYLHYASNHCCCDLQVLVPQEPRSALVASWHSAEAVGLSMT